MARHRVHNRALVQGIGSKVAGSGVLIAGFLLAASLCFGAPQNPSLPHMFKPESTPAGSIVRIALFVLLITGAIFVVVFCLLVYSVSKFVRVLILVQEGV
jgi:hypothetical protein